MTELDAILAQFTEAQLDALERGQRKVDADADDLTDDEMDALLTFMELDGYAALARAADAYQAALAHCVLAA